MINEVAIPNEAISEDLIFFPKIRSIMIITNAKVPIIISGGARGFNDFENAKLNGAQGFAAGSFFIFEQPNNAVLITYPKYELIKQKLGTTNEC